MRGRRRMAAATACLATIHARQRGMRNTALTLSLWAESKPIRDPQRVHVQYRAARHAVEKENHRCRGA